MKEHITPEVGDVWEYTEEHKKYFIVKEKRVKDVFDGFVDGVLGINEDFEKTWFNKKKFPKTATCLGKSKANIDDLFKTENEE